ncbi:MAG: lipopolysaccharide biosynthesis protein RfbH [Candidatus Buchananbacteria bacterium RIFCSPHIGHO2_02_FULL_45_11b]|uniref:Lipopolysaccharide biosynthesis protein RfbH n=1 Tax=Candidatus Buchananbacteria bacterium RIFCSPHIGHO2_02_FULL_45_11b TaxID=1797541 RepID=A0A1G1YFK3_9BACT|nr:MAG: lipopolysaccharide biosynthesis protein RfbH [Candidatus Buchananbacteria bacterium RIFCSPHIGHO2_02_FULL_45_11b]
MNQELENLIRKHYQENFANKKIVPGKNTIPASGKFFGAEELVAMTQAVLEGWWTEGRYAEEFENKFAGWLGVKYCTTTNSGSSANLIAVAALTSFRLGEKRLKPGDEVITIAAGFPTTVNPLIVNQLVPVFVDIEIETLNIKADDLEKAVSQKTKAVILPHNIGNAFNLKAVKALCEKRQLWLIEDCCDALGTTYDGKLVGTFGDLATFSFYAGHHMAMGEGGAVVTSDEFLNRIVRSVRDWGRDCQCKTGHDNTCGKRFVWKLGDLPEGYDHKFIFSEIGYNLRITDIQAALGLVQLEKLPIFTQRRKDNFSYLLNKLKEFEKYFILPKAENLSEPSWFGFYLTLKPNCPFKRFDLVQFLETNKILTRLILAGNLCRQPYFLNYNVKYRKADNLANTDIVMNNSFWVGCYHGLNKEHMEYIYQNIKKFIDQYDDR